MKTIEVKVQRDHLERLATRKSPLAAISELVWNSLDADASSVRVSFRRNSLSGIEEVQVSDDGRGLPYEEAESAFERLGGSWKAGKNRTPGGRILHGLQGKGRFQAFALGANVEWHTRYAHNGRILEYRIYGKKTRLHQFMVDEPVRSDATSPGTLATISGVDRSLAVLETPRARQALNEEFALYLRQYSSVTIDYDGEPLDPSAIEEHVEDYTLADLELSDGRTVSAELTVVEWSVNTDRALFLCDADGFALHKVAPGIHAPGFVFTAYLKSPLLRELWSSGDLQLEELHPDLGVVLEAAKEQLREHFRRRAAEQAENLVERWKTEEVYPFEGAASSVIEQAERQVFDVLALNVHEYLPDFDGTSRENRKLSFRLLRTAVETSPEAVQTILRDVLNLPQQKQEELAELLERTSLEAIINASKVVADRLDFLQGLELLVFDPQGKKKTLERRHLHKIVAEHTWLFGEEFNLTASDRSLTNVLKRHVDLAQVELLDDSPVVREDGSEGIVDLMFSRVVPQSRADQNEHLVVELKRPSVNIGNDEATQIKNYATAIVNDDRFKDTDTRWEFWAVSSDMSEAVRLEVNQAGRPAGLLWHLEDYRLKIWVRTWGQIIEDCRARLRFFQERLSYAADEDSGLEYLRRVHEAYLPGPFAKDDEDEEGEQPTNYCPRKNSPG